MNIERFAQLAKIKNASEGTVGFAQSYVDRSVAHEFIMFTEDCLGGCWLGRYGLLTIEDGAANLANVYKLQTEAEVDAEQAAFEAKRPAMRKARHDSTKHRWADTRATVERPWAVRLFGNDDSTYAIYVATREQAEAIFEEIKAFAPYTYNEIMNAYPFVFTN